MRQVVQKQQQIKKNNKQNLDEIKFRPFFYFHYPVLYLYLFTKMFIPTERFNLVLSKFKEAHSTDPEKESLIYHSTLASYSTKLSNSIPSEALLLASNSQHIKRWEKPRSDYPLGLSSYKQWRTNLNKFHTQVTKDIMLSSGYSEEEDSVLLSRVSDLLLKRTLQRPPLSSPLKGKCYHFHSILSSQTYLTIPNI